MREVTANTIGKKPGTNPSDQKLLDKKRRDLLRRERIRKFRENSASLSMMILRPVSIRKLNNLNCKTQGPQLDGDRGRERPPPNVDQPPSNPARFGYQR